MGCRSPGTRVLPGAVHTQEEVLSTLCRLLPSHGALSCSSGPAVGISWWPRPPPAWGKGPGPALPCWGWGHQEGPLPTARPCCSAASATKGQAITPASGSTDYVCTHTYIWVYVYGGRACGARDKHAWAAGSALQQGLAGPWVAGCAIGAISSNLSRWGPWPRQGGPSPVPWAAS